MECSLAEPRIIPSHIFESLLTKALEIDANITLAQDNLGLAYVQKGEFEKGVRLVEQSVRNSGPNDVGKLLDLAYAYSKSEAFEKTRKILLDLLVMRAKNQSTALPIAGVYSCLREIDNAYSWLEDAIEERDSYVRSVNSDFVFENIRSDPRFPALLKKIGLGQTGTNSKEKLSTVDHV